MSLIVFANCFKYEFETQMNGINKAKRYYKRWIPRNDICAFALDVSALENNYDS